MHFDEKHYHAGSAICAQVLRLQGRGIVPAWVYRRMNIEVEDSVNPGVNMVFPYNEIQKTAWEVRQNFDHTLILREDDPLLPAVLDVYEKQGIRDGAPILFT